MCKVIRLMVNVLFVEDDDVLTKPGVVRRWLKRGGRPSPSATGNAPAGRIGGTGHLPGSQYRRVYLR
jgi:hypothetical protein